MCVERAQHKTINLIPYAIIGTNAKTIDVAGPENDQSLIRLSCPQLTVKTLTCTLPSSCNGRTFESCTKLDWPNSEASWRLCCSRSSTSTMAELQSPASICSDSLRANLISSSRKQMKWVELEIWMGFNLCDFSVSWFCYVWVVAIS